MKFERAVLILNEEKPDDEKSKLMQQVIPILSSHIKN